MTSQYTDTITATEDPPPQGVVNPIHNAEGADAAGYPGALVAGVRTYGWAAETISRALGAAWLESGWVDFSLRRPLYAGEFLSIEVTRQADDWQVICSTDDDGQARVVLDGTAGHGEAPWLGELESPAFRAAQVQPAQLSGYDLAHVPLRQPLNPLTVHLSSLAARKMVAEDLGLDADRYLDPGIEPAFIHPYFVAGRMAPLTRHNFVYGPTIHVRSQIQHRREPRADCDITVGAQIVDAYDRKGHWYQVLDGMVTDDSGTLALIRHHSIFRPRGT